MKASFAAALPELAMRVLFDNLTRNGLMEWRISGVLVLFLCSKRYKPMRDSRYLASIPWKIQTELKRIRLNPL
jgi:hypothetical protein